MVALAVELASVVVVAAMRPASVSLTVRVVFQFLERFSAITRLSISRKQVKTYGIAAQAVGSVLLTSEKMAVENWPSAFSLIHAVQMGSVSMNVTLISDRSSVLGSSALPPSWPLNSTHSAHIINTLGSQRLVDRLSCLSAGFNEGISRRAVRRARGRNDACAHQAIGHAAVCIRALVRNWWGEHLGQAG